jgi:bifunctional DNA primase/polymerase-like protein
MVDGGRVTLEERLELLKQYGRAYGDLKLAVGWTLGMVGDNAKVSRHWQSRPDRLRDAQHGAGLFHRGITHNPVISLKASGLLGIDIDGPAGRKLLYEVIPEGLPATVIVRSGREDVGWHAWFRPPEGGTHHKIEFGADGLELVSDGYLVCPPAIHGATQRPYSFAAGRAPWEIEIATFPDAVYQRLTSLKRQSNEAERSDDHSPIPFGGRHKHLLRLGCAMRRAGAGEATILAALYAENERRCVPPQESHLVEALATDIVARYPPGVRA